MESDTSQVSEARTDRNNNPTAFDAGVAVQAGLVFNVDYAIGDPFESGGLRYYTAKLLGDPVSLTVRVINIIGFYTSTGTARWSYIAIPKFAWYQLNHAQRINVIGWMYSREGGTAMRHLFPNYGKW